MWVVLAWTTLTDKDHVLKLGAMPGILALVLTFGVYVMVVAARTVYNATVLASLAAVLLLSWWTTYLVLMA
jgi:hypothetical protein